MGKLPQMREEFNRKRRGVLSRMQSDEMRRSQLFQVPRRDVDGENVEEEIAIKEYVKLVLTYDV